jgi:hypothetical protein
MAEGVGPSVKTRGHGVWVPAFAGTTKKIGRALMT